MARSPGLPRKRSQIESDAGTGPKQQFIAPAPSRFRSIHAVVQDDVHLAVAIHIFGLYPVIAEAPEQRLKVECPAVLDVVPEACCCRASLRRLSAEFRAFGHGIADRRIYESRSTAANPLVSRSNPCPKGEPYWS
jgi:hypothetical protein